MGLEQFVFLSDDNYSQRLVVSWPVVGMGVKKINFDILEKWAAKAAIPVEAALDRYESLFSAQICTLNGGVDPMALRYIEREVARKAGMLHGREKTKPKEEEKSAGTDQSSKTGQSKKAKKKS